MYRYQTDRKLYVSENGKPYFSYYITLEHSEKCVDDVTLDESKAEQLVHLLNAGQIQPQFLLPFISTFLDG